jgi:hypothetical protein
MVQPAVGQSCKWDVEKPEKRNGTTLRMVTLPLGPSAYNWKLVLEQRNGRCYVGLHIKWGGQYKSKIIAGQKIIINLENDEKVVLLAYHDYLPNYVADKHGEEITTYFPNGEISKEQLEKLSHLLVKKIHIKIETDVLEIDKFSDKQQDDVMKYAACLLALN